MLDLPIGIVAAAVAYGLTMFTLLTLCLVWPNLPELMEENAEHIFEMVPRLHPMGFAAIAAVIGVYEELVFRGFLMTRLRRATGSWTVAVLVSTAVFTGLHSLDQVSVAVISIAVLSLVFSVVTIWRRSIIPAIVAHTLWNLSQFLYLSATAGDTWT